MRQLTKKFIWLSALAVLTLGLVQCNTATDGFKAPVGSTIEPPSGGTIETTGDFLLLLNFGVTVKSTKLTIVKDGPPTETPIFIPGNDIFIMFTCTSCAIYDRAAGEEVTVPDITRLEEVGNPYESATDSRGVKTIVVLLRSPATFGVTSYKAVIGADIGVASELVEITVSLPAT